MSRTVLVVGGGAAGMAAAYFAAGNGADVLLLEKNEKLGKKIYITGKGRGNVTNACTRDVFLEHVVSNARFLYSSLQHFGPAELMEQIEALGTPLKTERGNRVFPVSDHASDITRAWQNGLAKERVAIRYGAHVSSLRVEGDRVTGVSLKDGEMLPADAVILAAGGLSYPSTGSTGDGYQLAREAGHTIEPTRPSLVPLVLAGQAPAALEGLSLRNCTLTVRQGKKTLYSAFGELVFTKDGISGPLALSASAYAGKALEKGNCAATLDLKPALTEEQVDLRLRRELEEAPKKAIVNILRRLLPASLCPVFLEQCRIGKEKTGNSIRKEERHILCAHLKQFPFTVTGTHGYTEAVITQGGVRVKEVEPATMASRIKKGLFFAGEILDLDALTGGFNLQIAWTTGAAAGRAAAKEEQEED